MKKKDYLELLMLLSALETWAFTISQQQRLPDWLHETLSSTIDMLRKKVLEEGSE